jgi:hypothetical protein
MRGHVDGAHRMRSWEAKMAANERLYARVGKC